MAQWPQVEVIAGAKQALELLHGVLPLAIATNASVSRKPMIELALQRADLAKYFEHIFCYTELGHRKDQPEFWRSVSTALGVPLERIAMVGDSYEQDAVAPRRFGVQGVWFNPSAVTESFGVPTVAELPAFSAWAAESAA